MAPTLEGRIVRLEPLTREHANGLWEASRDPRTWRCSRSSSHGTPEELRRWIDEALAGSDEPFATVLLETGRAAGSTRFLAHRPAPTSRRSCSCSSTRSERWAVAASN